MTSTSDNDPTENQTDDDEGAPNANSDTVSRQIAYAETYDDVYGLTFPARYPGAGNSRNVT